jgi:hypothetical protein
MDGCVESECESDTRKRRPALLYYKIRLICVNTSGAKKNSRIRAVKLGTPDSSSKKFLDVVSVYGVFIDLDNICDCPRIQPFSLVPPGPHTGCSSHSLHSLHC